MDRGGQRPRARGGGGGVGVRGSEWARGRVSGWRVKGSDGRGDGGM